jgi:peptidoglycan hydrolase CwlO-like protein
MELFKKKTTQIIALVTIIGTLAGFGYTGATYVNRLENLEKKIGGIAVAKTSTQDLEKRFASIETSIKYINKSIDEGITPSLKTQAQEFVRIKTALATLKADVKNLKKDREGNPLLGN